MSGTATIQVSEIRSPPAADFVLPDGFSFFKPYLRHSIKEVLELGGEAYAARNPDGSIAGIFIYDDYEKTGTVYTRSEDVFDYFYELKPFNYLWSELSTEHELETYDIYNIRLDEFPVAHSFKHEISVATDQDAEEIEQFMTLTQPGLNPRAVKVAFRNGDKCI